jgi:phospholipid/cholesterol/gamma-HCH transport system ATP-binding protein
MPEREGVRRRKDRVMSIIDTLPRQAQDGIIESLTPEERERYRVGTRRLATAGAFRPSPRPRTSEWEGARGDLHSDVADVPKSDWKADPPSGSGDRA